MAPHKMCHKCLVRQPAEAFYKSKKHKDGLQTQCKTCISARSKSAYALRKEQHDAAQKTWRERNPDYFFSRDLRRKYGITIDDYKSLLQAQNNLCACCQSPDPGGRSDNDRFHVDHDHLTGKVRGLLCHKCNTGLGLLGDNVDGLMRAVSYLQQTSDLLMEVKTSGLD